MSMGVATARTQLCLKRLLDEPRENLPKCKLPRLAPNLSTTGLSPCLRPRSPAPKSNRSQSPSRVGPYFLLERCEGEDTYKAEHAHTKQQYTCQVELQILQKILHICPIIFMILQKILLILLIMLQILLKILLLLLEILIFLYTTDTASNTAKNTHDTAKIHAHKQCSFYCSNCYHVTLTVPSCCRGYRCFLCVVTRSGWLPTPGSVTMTTSAACWTW